MKKTILIILFLIVSFSLVSSLDPSSVESVLDSNIQNLEETQESVEQFTYTEGRTYLIEEWKKIFLKNPTILKMNSFFEKLNFLFVFLFAQGYAFSFSLFFTMILWFFMMYNMLIILKDYSLFNKYASFVLSFGLATILSHVQFFSLILGIVERVSFSNEYAFFRELIYVGFLIFLGFVLYVNVYIGKMLIAIRKEGDVAKERYNRKILGKIVNSLLGGISKEEI